MSNERTPSSGFNAKAVDTSVIDDFLASELVRPDSVSNFPKSPSFAELEPEALGDVVLLVPAEDDGERFSAQPGTLAALREEIQNWLAMLRSQGQMMTELLPLSVRDQSARTIVNRFLEAAYNSPTRSWMTALPTGRQLVILPAALANNVDFESICRVVHKRAIMTARAAGLPFNERAFSQYQNHSPVDTA